MTARVGNPFPLFLARSGYPLDGGRVYLGEDGEDPESSPITAYFDEALTIEAPQPILTIGGLLVRNGSPAFVYTAEDAYSMRVRDADGAEVFYASTALFQTSSYQPLDDDLTAIAALSTSSFGRGLLALGSGAAVRSYIGIAYPNPTESLILAASDESTALTTGAAKLTFRMPYAFTLSAVRASLKTAQVSGSILTVDVNENGASILSTKLTIDNAERTSTTAATPAVISDSALADDAEITIDIDQIGDGTATGLKVTLIGTRP